MSNVQVPSVATTCRSDASEMSWTTIAPCGAVPAKVTVAVVTTSPFDGVRTKEMPGFVRSISRICMRTRRGNVSVRS